MKDKIFGCVNKYIAVHGMIEPGDCVLAGISGGADSVCMLHLLVRMQEEIPFRLAVVHVNHGLRAEAGEDAAFVERLCAQWGIPFFLRKVDMPGYAREHKVSEEEAGRILRYQAFVQILGEIRADAPGKIAVAHNAEDRAETMLFHMFRGSGLKGLASIRPVRESVIRPVLCLNRAQIEAYLNAKGLTWCEDSTNREDTYARNRIRHHILSYAQQEICQGTVSHMGELADILSETEDYLERETDRLYDRYVTENLTYSVSQENGLAGEVKIQLTGLGAEDIVMRKRVLFRALEKMTPHRKDITGRHIKAILTLMDKDGSKELSLPYGIEVYKEYGILFLRRPEEWKRSGSTAAPGGRQKSALDQLQLDVLAEIPLNKTDLTPGVPLTVAVPGTGGFLFTLWEADFAPPISLFYRKEQNNPENRYTKWFDYDKITTSLLLRTRRTGDYLTIDEALHTQSVKQYMINEKIPKGKRDGMYLLADGAHILWVPGYRTSRRYKVEKNTRRILEVRLIGGNDGGTYRSVVDGRGSR
ncbi:MAG: tRNA lysidine(34) synthetase TilS [Lachnospiraceae bacterium]|nr:tRNA lysidine(34) synthetase TilS [Lachnospiraceae bacterium]